MSKENIHIFYWPQYSFLVSCAADESGNLMPRLQAVVQPLWVVVGLGRLTDNSTIE